MQKLIQKIKYIYNHHASLDNGVLLVALLLAAGILWNTLGALQRNFELQQQVDRMKQENEVLKLQNQLLAFQQRYYKSNEFLQLSAKERLNKADPGEKVIILPVVAPQPDDIKPVKAATNSLSNFQQWLVFLFGRK